MRPHFNVTDVVHVKSVGEKSEFTGTVVLVAINHNNKIYYHVRDENGLDWNRSEHELSGSLAE